MGAKTATTRTVAAKAGVKAKPATKSAATSNRQRATPAAKKAAPARKAAPAAKKPAPVAKKVASATRKAAPAAKKAAPVKNVALVKNAAPVSAVPMKPVSTKAAPASAASPSRSPTRVLTESEILRAPEKDYMNAAQLLFFRSKLQGMEQDILRNAGETTEHLRESIIVPDPADRATIEEEHALELRTRDRERKLLKKIQQSIQRLDSGEYGYCEETGDPIGVPRLLARPTATLSLEAQERREMKQRMFGE